ncbi:MAG: hypothetical protein Q4G08_11555, partial [Capnocytophaga sp.]|nr:hypothetical protein [Capnocytophaga sp.]
MTPKNTLKNWFKNLLKPTQEQFWAWMDSYWHKSEKIPSANIEGLEKILQGVATAESVEAKADKAHTHGIDDITGLRGELDGKAPAEHTHEEYATWGGLETKADKEHTHTDLASKTELSNKVDKVTGRQLSEENFTPFEKQKLAGLQNYTLPPLLSSITQGNKEDWNMAYAKRPVSMAVTGSASKTIVLTLNDGTTVEANFTDEQGVPVDIKLNSVSFNKDTGIFSAVNSDGQTITASFDG